MTAKKITRKQIYMPTVVTLARRNQGHRIKSKVVHDLFLSLLIQYLKRMGVLMIAVFWVH